MNQYEEKIKKCREYISSKCSGDSIKLLKGGAYKIKGYYLETNNLNEIRGASVNLSHVEETVIPEKITERYSESCIIYNGGGNIFCILPPDAGEEFTLSLETEAQKYLVSAGTAYVVMESSWEEIDNNYRETMRKLEQKLADRKKLKVSVDINPESAFFEKGEIPWKDAAVPLNAALSGGGLCRECRTKYARYNSGGKRVCASCLHKIAIGSNAKKSKYADEYRHYTGNEPVFCRTIQDISGDYIAVVYGDGNNMGQIIQNFNHITEMMEFSENVKKMSNEAVFKAMEQTNIRRFEVVGLGGDDVFVIVSGGIAMEFALRLIENYNNEFRRTGQELKENPNPYKSTMSVGICIAKSNTPVKVMLEAAEDKLSEAKELAKRANMLGMDNGSIAYAILDDPAQSAESVKNKFGASLTMQPYDLRDARTILDKVRELKKSDTGKTRLRNMYNAYMNADTPEEVKLFFRYQNVRLKDKLIMPELEGRKQCDGIYTDSNGKSAALWADILDMYEFSKVKEADK